MMPVRTVLLAAAVLAGLALLGAAAYLYAARTSAPTAPPARPTGETAAAVAPGDLAFTPHPEPRPLPELRFVDGAGRALSLADFRGRVVLLNIWATWCVPCREEMPALDRLQANLGGPEFEVVALSIDRGGVDAVRAFYQELDLRALGIYLDRTGDAMRALGLVGLPTTLLIDREGREIGRVLGAAAWDGPEVVGVIRRYLGVPPDKGPAAGGEEGVPGPRSEDAPPAARRFATGGLTLTTLTFQ